LAECSELLKKPNTPLIGQTLILSERWSHFLRQPAKVDSTMQRTIHHEDAETVFGGVQGQGRT
jgi:hypothetical protein